MLTEGWNRVRAWPNDPARSLGLPPGTEDSVRDLFDNRFRLEVLRIGGETDIRVRCRHGEVFPVNAATWGWIGPSGKWTLRLTRLLGSDATNPARGKVTAGTKYDESHVRFPVAKLREVLAAVGARKRSKGRPGGNPAWNPLYKVPKALPESTQTTGVAV